MARQARLGARLNRAAALALVLAAVPGAVSRADGLRGSEGGGDLVIRFLDVGQGDGVLITLPDGKVVLVDGWTPQADADDRLRELGVDHIDLLVATRLRSRAGSNPSVGYLSKMCSVPGLIL